MGFRGFGVQGFRVEGFRGLGFENPGSDKAGYMLWDCYMIQDIWLLHHTI